MTSAQLMLKHCVNSTLRGCLRSRPTGLPKSSGATLSFPPISKREGWGGGSIVQKWEIGEKKPSGPALKLLNIVKRKGLKALA